MCDHPHSEQTEADLVKRLQQGDLEAFDRLFERHRKPILAYVAGMLRDTGLAEDVVQECFVELARHIGDIDPERGVRPWLFRVARNRAIDQLRRRREAALPEGEQDKVERPDRGAALDESPPSQLAAKERDAQLKQAVALLEPKDRDLLMLRFYGDLKFREIAKVTRRPLGTVLRRFPRALPRLREKLGERGASRRAARAVLNFLVEPMRK